MFKQGLKFALYGIIAIMTVSATPVRADEEPFYFCAGAFVEEMQANAVIVLRADMAKVDPKAKRYLNCQLPDVDETTLLRLITSGKNKELESSGLQYFTELSISGQLLPVKVIKISTFAYERGKISQNYQRAERLCGLVDFQSSGLVIRKSSDNPGCNSKNQKIFGTRQNGEYVEIFCQPGHDDCLLIVEFGGWEFSLKAEKQSILENWRAFSGALKNEISNRVVLNFTPDGCVGEACALLDRLIKHKLNYYRYLFFIRLMKVDWENSLNSEITTGMKI
ncbi:hypothetical protein E1180_11535 [Roseibium denhamense]|uniref:Uncharacterized protein n=1 Tax=Roseibium denhamense TaxID=76305 RepID=A0ABY1PER6_9HYPH|nr:hypothetical protein [Roseibium denhamense]MTI06145.1 hypothetical protein [Roseibium denhamense]SMP32211.1 hypothetical protein SAMN06265374_3499 [Roseibium denhamense]